MNDADAVVPELQEFSTKEQRDDISFIVAKCISIDDAESSHS